MATAVQEELEADGFVEVTDHPRLRVGGRVHNRGEQFPRARREGTATVLTVLERKNDTWSKTYGRPNIEVVVERDDGTVSAWADYGTHVVEVTARG